MRGATAAGAAVPARAAATPPPPSPSLPSPWPPIDWTEPVLRATAVVWQCCVLPVLQAETQAALLDASLALSAALILAAVLLCPRLALLASDREVQQVLTLTTLWLLNLLLGTAMSMGWDAPTAHRAAVGCGDDKSRRRPETRERG
jgi:hypothetical protein